MNNEELNNSKALNEEGLSCERRNRERSHAERKIALETAMRYIGQQENSSVSDILFF